MCWRFKLVINFDWILERPDLLRRVWPLCDIVNRFKFEIYEFDCDLFSEWFATRLMDGF